MITIPGASAGDITRVIAGDGLSGGATDGDATLTLDLHELTAAAVADGDFIPIIDTNDSNGSRKEAVHDLATLFAGTGLTATNSVIAVDAAQSQITTVGTIATGTWEGTTVAVDQGGTGATSLSNLITLTTHTSGNYVATITGGTGITSSAGTTGEGTTHSLSIDASQTQITAVGTIATGTWEGTTVAVDQGGTGATSLSNLITLATHTTGDFVATITAGTGLTSTGGTSGEDIDHGLSVDAAQTGITSLGTQAANFAVGNGYGVIVGNATQETVSIGDGSTDMVPELQVLGTTADDSSILLAAFSNTATTAGSPILAFAKGGHATLGSHTVVTDGEELGNIIAFGDDGSDLETPAASIQFEVDGTPGAGDMPGRIIFGTTKDEETAVTEAVRIDSSQNVTFAQGIIVEPAASAADDGIANTTGTGLVATMRALTGVSVGELLHIDANGDLDQAHADADADMPAIGIALTANSSGSDANIQVLLQGFYRDDSQFSFGTKGAPIYADHGTEGNFTDTPSTTDGHFIQRVGIALTDDMIYFNPSLDEITRD